MNRALAGISALLLASCSRTVDLGADVYVVPFVLGTEATCASSADGGFYCVGVGTDGRLGIPVARFDEPCGERPCTSTFMDVQHAFVGDAAFYEDGGCFAIGDGVACSGRNDVGQGGVEPLDDAVTMELRYIDSFANPIEVEAGRAHACALVENGQVLCWGLGSHGQLGVDPLELDDCGVADSSDAARLAIGLGDVIRCSGTPRLIAGIDDAVDVATNDFGSCVLREGGELRCFGRNVNGALGLGASPSATVPTRVDVPEVARVEAAGGNVCAILRDGRLACAGENASGQLGALDGTAGCAEPPCSTSMTVLPVGRVVDVALGARTTYVVDASHRLLASGADDRGQLGDGDGSPGVCEDVPCARAFVPVALERHAVFVRAGGMHACALATDRRTYCFGSGGGGETASSFHEDQPSPVEIALP